jgi:hypothetical protein
MAEKRRMISGSSALNTSDIWSKTIGLDKHAGAGDSTAANGGDSEQVANIMKLAALSNVEGANRGGCKRCGGVGHLTFQCRNAPLSAPGQDSISDSSSSDDSDDSDDSSSDSESEQVPIVEAVKDTKRSSKRDKDKKAVKSSRDIKKQEQKERRQLKKVLKKEKKREKKEKKREKKEEKKKDKKDKKEK